MLFLDKVYQRACAIPPGFHVFYEVLDSTGQVRPMGAFVCVPLPYKVPLCTMPNLLSPFSNRIEENVLLQEENDDVLTEKILWSDAFVLTYSVTDRLSFDEIARLKFRITHTWSRKVTSVLHSC